MIMLKTENAPADRARLFPRRRAVMSSTARSVIWSLVRPLRPDYRID
jgi:hypothetical protein